MHEWIRSGAHQYNRSYHEDSCAPDRSTQVNLSLVSGTDPRRAWHPDPLPGRQKEAAGSQGAAPSAHAWPEAGRLDDEQHCPSFHKVKETGGEGGKPADPGSLKNTSTPRRRGRGHATRLSALHTEGPITSRAESTTRVVCTGQALGWSTARAGFPPSRKPVQSLSVFCSAGHL